MVPQPCKIKENAPLTWKFETNDRENRWESWDLSVIGCIERVFILSWESLCEFKRVERIRHEENL